MVGHPVAHSLSPDIHRAFAIQTGQSLSYEAIEAPLKGFEHCVASFLADGGRGLNVTVPFKEQAFRLATVCSDAATMAGAANTLMQRADGSLYADNTDGAGLMRDLLHNAGVVLRGRRILLIGAGGAMRGILAPLAAEQPAAVVLVNRTEQKATELAARFAAQMPITAAPIDRLDGAFDVIINGTSAGLSGSLPALPQALYKGVGLVYDMVYGPPAEPFLRHALQQGAQRVSDGLGMLVEQAAQAFALWRGVRPDTAAVLARLGASRRAQV